MVTSAWSTQQLAEFVVSVSAADSEEAAALTAVERAAEALDVDVAAIVGGGKVVAAVGYAVGTAAAADLEAVKPGDEGSSLDVPGVGHCAAAAASLEYPPGATFVVARPGPGGLTREETGLLRSMGRVASLTIRMLHLLGEERAAREQLLELAREQAALRRVATLVAEAASPDAVFSAVAEEVAQLSEADVANVLRFEEDGSATVIGGHGDPALLPPIGARLAVAGEGVVVAVLRTGRSARADRFCGPPGSAGDTFRRAGVRTGSGSPIIVEGRLWGAVVAARARPEPLTSAAERRISAFTELVATAIANAQARVELRAVADEQAALRRVATLVARAVPPAEVFAAVAEEVGRLLSVDLMVLARYDPEDVFTVLGAWSPTGDTPAIGLPRPLARRGVTARVRETGRPARVDFDVDGRNPAPPSAVKLGIRSAFGAPINIEGRAWGVAIVASTSDEPPPPETEERLAAFTELVATAVANTQSRAELEASRSQCRRAAEEQAALRRVATLVARGVPAAEIFDAVASETKRVLDVDGSALMRFESDGSMTMLAADSVLPHVSDIGERIIASDGTAAARVLATGRPARVESYDAAAGWTAGRMRTLGYRGSVGAPVVVEGRIWGAIIASWAQGRAMPTDTEGHLVQFTELVATAIANAQAQAELTASRARIVATADETRRRIERDLHDGAQQRLVSLALQLRAAQDAVPPELDALAAELGGVAAGLNHALDDLREFARGIHPAILAEGGLAAALSTLARRSAVAVDLDVRVHQRLPEPIEVGAYYVVSEARANASKHAEASSAFVEVEALDDVLRVSVRDDGVGGADFAHGSGLVGLKDRVEALGGRIGLESPHGMGTSVEVELPLTAGAPVAFG
jgi:signal transduction histidine kinase